ncbi:MAG TPA: sulfurtransferase [Bryobacteraceae bacterium]|nr:sulfurtransferase [Bryobacteraceae bacterium]
MTVKLLGSVLATTLTLAAAPAARKDMLVSTDWLAQHLNDANVVVLQVSANRNAYDAGHIPGARFVALPEIAITRNGVPNELPDVPVLKKVFEGVGVSDNSHVILYGDASVLPATRAYFTLDYLGHGDRAALLDGGLDKWKSEGRMLSKDAPPVGQGNAAQGNLTPRLKPEIVVQMDAVKEVAGKPQSSGPLLIDARPATDYSGEKGSHIPTAVNQNWMDSQVSKDNQTLKSEADLRRLYEAAGVKGDRPVVTYCNSGMQASQSYFTLKYLGYDVKMYDGSMSEWNLKGAPVEK